MHQQLAADTTASKPHSTASYLCGLQPTITSWLPVAPCLSSGYGGGGGRGGYGGGGGRGGYGGGGY